MFKLKVFYLSKINNCFHEKLRFYIRKCVFFSYLEKCIRKEYFSSLKYFSFSILTIVSTLEKKNT